MDSLLRSCKRCLVYAEADAKTRSDFEMLINGIPANERASVKIYDERLGKCESCQYLLSGTCQACGCFVELRAASRSSKCPKKYW